MHMLLWNEGISSLEGSAPVRLALVCHWDQQPVQIACLQTDHQYTYLDRFLMNLWYVTCIPRSFEEQSTQEVGWTVTFLWSILFLSLLALWIPSLFLFAAYLLKSGINLLISSVSPSLTLSESLMNSNHSQENTLTKRPKVHFETLCAKNMSNFWCHGAVNFPFVKGINFALDTICRPQLHLPSTSIRAYL